jgi:hypothetical protein
MPKMHPEPNRVPRLLADEPNPEMRERIEELQTCRDAGLLTEVELEEQLAKLRWGIR